jgi:DNA-binding transcriptional LysR family regulator
MAMELRHLRYFIAVAEEGHITRAAERLGMQQPPLSQQIKALERELDVQLLRRKPRGVELTDAGHAFFDNARAILAQLEHTRETTQRTARGEQGQISLSYTGSFHPLVPRIIRTFRKAFPLVSVTLSEGFPHDLIERIRSDQTDVAFLRTPVADPEGIAIEQLLEETMVVALPSEHALARGKPGRSTGLSLKALAGETFIVFGTAQGALTLQSNALIATCQTIGFNPRVGQVVSNNLVRLHLIASGLGIAVVSASMQRTRIEGVVFRRLRGARHLKTPLNLASRRGDPSVAVRNFLNLARRTAKNFRVDEGKSRR